LKKKEEKATNKTGACKVMKTSASVPIVCAEKAGKPKPEGGVPTSNLMMRTMITTMML
jgi:hypothetical protein